MTLPPSPSERESATHVWVAKHSANDGGSVYGVYASEASALAWLREHRASSFALGDGATEIERSEDSWEYCRDDMDYYTVQLYEVTP